MTWTYIAENNLTGTSNTVTFNSISQAYTDLKIIAYTKNVSSGNTVLLRINGDSGANYSYSNVYNQYNPGNNLLGTTYGSTSIALGFQTAPVTSIYDIDIFQYANNQFKQVRCNTVETIAVSNMAVGMVTGMWFSTSAINSITIQAGASGTFGSGTKVALYGIKAV